MQIRQGNAQDIEERKISEAMLARYHRWVFEYNKEGSVLSLREWLLQESELQTIATEAVCGLSGKATKPPYRSTPRQGNQRTFFGEADSVCNSKKMPCLDCGKNHGIWNCPKFNRRKVADRWNFVSKQKRAFNLFHSQLLFNAN